MVLTGPSQPSGLDRSAPSASINCFNSRLALSGRLIAAAAPLSGRNTQGRMRWSTTNGVEWGSSGLWKRAVRNWFSWELTELYRANTATRLWKSNADSAARFSGDATSSCQVRSSNKLNKTAEDPTKNARGASY